MDININSTISGRSATGAGESLKELLGCEEYEKLLSQVKELFAESIENKNINGFMDKKDFHGKLLFADSERSGENRETENISFDSEILSEKIPGFEKDTELFLEAVMEKTADALKNISRKKRKSMQAQGIAAAKARGVKCGRPEKELPENFILIARQQACGRISIRTAASLCGMSVSTFARRKKKLAEMKMITDFQEIKNSKIQK